MARRRKPATDGVLPGQLGLFDRPKRRPPKGPRCTLCGTDTPGPRYYCGLVEGVVHQDCADKLDAMVAERGFEVVWAEIRMAREAATVKEYRPAVGGGRALWYWE